VSAKDSGSGENLCDGFDLHPPWTPDFLDPVPGSGGDAQVFQQSSKPVGENWSIDPEGLHLIRILVNLLILGVAQGRVLFIGLIFYILVHSNKRQAVTPGVVAHFEVPADQRQSAGALACGTAIASHLSFRKGRV
jgi:hypothetical protein